MSLSQPYQGCVWLTRTTGVENSMSCVGIAVCHSVAEDWL